MDQHSPHNQPSSDYACQLTQLGMITLSGEEQESYLQGQITADVATVTGDKALLGCHCDFKGKTWSVFQLLKDKRGLHLLGHQESLSASLAELKKYGVFAKVDIADSTSEWAVFGVTGNGNNAYLNNYFGQLPSEHQQVTRTEQGWLVCQSSPCLRYLAIVPAAQAQQFAAGLKDYNDSHQQWEAWDIQAGIADIREATVNQFVPQMMNLQALDAISFSKGCYMGQEVVARTRYLGKNKRAAFVLQAEQTADIAPGDGLEIPAGDNWRPGGTVLRSAVVDNQTWVLAVMAKDTEIDSAVRCKTAVDTTFRVHALPYDIE